MVPEDSPDVTEATPDAEVSPDVSPDVTPDVIPPVFPGGPVRGTSCSDAERACLLTFKGTSGLQTFSLAATTPNVAFTPPIISKDPKVSIGILNSNIEGEFIGDDGSVTLFSDLPVPGGQSFSPNFFKTFTIMRTGMSGIGHESLQVGQADVVGDKCVRVFITEWQVLNRRGMVVDNINGVTDKSLNACVVFKTSL